jgi:2,3-bisphosphoglycerate-independent phosphoglycerate mutase
VARPLRAGHGREPGHLSAPPADSPRRVLLVFIDGVGLGSSDPLINPLAGAELPTFRALLDGAGLLRESVEAAPLHTPIASLQALDATLETPGRPQSGTGQTSLLTGFNAARAIGRHFGPWVPTTLRDLLSRENLFLRHREAGRSVAFANAYPRAHLVEGGRGRRRPGAFPLAAEAAGVLTRTEQDVHTQTGLVSSITTESWRRYVDPGAPEPSATEAGRQLARIARDHELTVFAHYDTDYVGHARDLASGVETIEKVDRFVGGVLDLLPGDALLLVTSDHGNLEDTSTGHTRAAVPLLAIGPARHAIDRARSVTDVAPLIWDILENRPARVRGRPPPDGTT